jgi:hypothetical protein
VCTAEINTELIEMDRIDSVVELVSTDLASATWREKVHLQCESLMHFNGEKSPDITAKWP